MDKKTPWVTWSVSKLIDHTSTKMSQSLSLQELFEYLKSIFMNHFAAVNLHLMKAIIHFPVAVFESEL